MPHQGWRTYSVLLFTHSWRENNWIHTFPKGISAMWNAISPGFELVLPCPIPATITITPLAPPSFLLWTIVAWGEWVFVLTTQSSSSCADSTKFLGSFTIHPYCPSLLAGPLNCIETLHRADVCKFYACWSPLENATHEFILTLLACLVCLIWMVCMMGGKWPYSCCFLEMLLPGLFIMACSILV